MSRLEVSLKTARWIATIRSAQLQKAEQDAATARREQELAKDAREAAFEESLKAQSAWAEYVGAGKSFDPHYSTICAREAEARREVLIESGRTLDASETLLASRRSQWNASMVVRERSDKTVNKAKTALLREREEKWLFDITEVRSAWSALS